MFKRNLLLFSFCLLSFGQLFAQSEVFRSKLWTTGDTLYLDTCNIIVGSVWNESYFVHVDFEVNYQENYIVWKSSISKPDSLIFNYRCLAVNLNKVHYRKDPKLKNVPYSEGQVGYVPSYKKKLSEKGSELTTMGNLSRGVGFGNTQDIVINSNLNLRINGILANDVEVIAAISDDNNPIQPEGNTQQLQDFDKVFIQLKKQNTSLILGDFEMKSKPDDYFMKFYKKSRGLHIDQTWKAKSNKIGTSLDVAVARGRFSRNLIEGIEGNRGPYRLKGSNGEIFIIIIAGTEQIFLDGNLLTRGEQNDYVIDYNSGELIFMPKVIISRYSRIIAEFQYSDRNYARSVVHNRNQWEHGNFNAYMNVYREADNKNQPFQQSLEGYDSIGGFSAREVLSAAGDVSQAYIPRVKKSSEFKSGVVLYRQKIDPFFGIYYEQVENTEGDSIYYEVTFSYVGQGNGNYRQKTSGINGRSYIWVSPIGGIPQGDYEPVDLLIPSKSYVMTNAGFGYQSNKSGNMKAEWAMSNKDLNTFSNKDDGDNTGHGLKLLWERNQIADTLHAWHFGHKASFEWVGRDFRYLERYRDVEFDRKWNRTLQNINYDTLTNRGSEYIGDVVLQTDYKQKGRIKYQLGLYEMAEVKKGINHQLDLSYHDKKIKSAVGAAFSHISQWSVINDFYQYDGKISKPMGNWEPGIYHHTERSLFANDSQLIGGSYGYSLSGVFLKKSQNEKGLSFLLDVSNRSDKQISENKLKPFTEARNVSLSGTWNGKASNYISITSTFRQLNFAVDSLLNENTLQSRLDASFYWLNKAIGWQTFVQTGTGQEQKREFSYLQVQSGNGIYIWNDYDSNGIQSLNEFEVASDLDRNRADYIRIFTPVQGFIQSYHSQFNQTLKLDPGRLVKSKKGGTHWLSRISSVNVLSMDRKLAQKLDWSILNPFGEIEDSSLISTAGSFRSTLFFNRSAPVFGCDYNWYLSQNKALLVNGFEWRKRTEHQLRFRWNISKQFTLQAEGKSGQRMYESAFFKSRSYSYNFSQLEPKLQFQYKNDLRFSVFYKWMHASNAPAAGKEKMESNELGMETRWLQSEKGSVSASMAWVTIGYTGETNTSLSYDLLQGLLPGSNLKWNLNIDRRMAEKIQVTLVYDGRKSVETKMIHIGRILARYIF